MTTLAVLPEAARPILLVAVGLMGLVSLAAAAGGKDQTVCDLGSRRELFVDDWLIADITGASLRLHHPVPREVVFSFDAPWEGNTCGYVTVFQDGDLYRMYYRGSDFDWKTKKTTHQLTCYAESKDGIHWTRPKLGLFEFNGSRDNNIVWMGPGVHNFTPFKDANPNCAPDARYKALGVENRALIAFKSPDGIHWSLMQKEPVITKGAFDSQNLAFWDPVRGRYVEFHRNFRHGVRDIMTCTSEDFLHWTEPVWLDYGDAPWEHLYTNAIQSYFRAPHIFMGFPGRFLPSRKRVPEHPEPGVSDGVFMTSRDGVHFHRWVEAFLRPGLRRDAWWERCNYAAWGMLVTKSAIEGLPDELSLYYNEHYYIDGNCLRRFTLRMDGFVSVHAGYPGGEFITRPLRFSGKRLMLNYSTSAAGGIQVEIQDEKGKPLPGFTLDDCPEFYGDAIEEAVKWEGGEDLSTLAGRTVRLRFVLRDADVYALRFAP